MSMLQQELYRMLHIHHIHTIPYHWPIERFNQTLKMTLQKTAVEEGKDWDTLLPCVLFTYREVEFHRILALRTVVWTRTEGVIRRAEGDVGRKRKEFGECRVTHPDHAGQNGCDKGTREGEHGKGTKHSEVVQPECLR